MKRAPRVLVTCGHYWPGEKAGGPIQSMRRILRTAPAVIDLALVTNDRDLGDRHPFPNLPSGWDRQGDARVYYLDTRSGRQSKRLLRDLRSAPWDLLYVNSLFSTFSLVPILAARFGVIRVRRVLVAPRGELSQGALELKSTKKSMFLKVWLPLLATMDVTWHAASAREKADVLARVPSARIELCLDPGDGPDQATAAGTPGAVPRLVFLSRISKMKNLDLALEALEAITAPVLVDIYGPTEDADYWRCLLYTSPSPRDGLLSRMPSSA